MMIIAMMTFMITIDMKTEAKKNDDDDNNDDEVNDSMVHHIMHK